MAETPGVSLPYSGEQLWGLTERLRLQIFKATLLLATLLVLPAAVMIVLVGRDIGVRLALLAVLGTFCALGAAHSGWCTDRLRKHQWLVFLTALLAGSVLVLGGARQNATFLVISVAAVGTPAIVEVSSAMIVGWIVAFAYVISILVRGEPLLLEGSAGDLAALISVLVAIYAAYRAAELMTMIVADVNRDAKEASEEVGEVMSPSRSGPFVRTSSPATSVSARVITEEATDQAPDEALRRLSEYDLTPAEREVAYLAGDGLQQKRIAERLGKSTKTVEHQLSSVKAKLEVKSHAALTAKVRRVLALPPGRRTDVATTPQGDGREPGPKT